MPIPSGWAAPLLSLMRIMVALLFMQHGTDKLFGFPDFGGSPDALTLPLGILEFGGGGLVMLGLFTRPIAFVLSGQMAVAYWWIHAPGSVFPALNGGEGAMLYCFAFLFLAAAGGGAWSLDAVMGARNAMSEPDQVSASTVGDAPSGFFIRDDLGQQPGQTGSDATNSPDIIVGAQDNETPDYYVQEWTYATAFPGTASFGQASNICVRALDVGGGSGTVFLFWAPNNIITYPYLWQQVGSQPIGPAPAGGVCSAPSSYFSWTPEDPGNGTGLTLIAFVMPTGQEPQLPENVGAFDDWVLATPNMAAIGVQFA